MTGTSRRISNASQRGLFETRRWVDTNIGNHIVFFDVPSWHFFHEKISVLNGRSLHFGLRLGPCWCLQAQASFDCILGGLVNVMEICLAGHRAFL